ncbi:hypothetical protein BOTBODRAFT_182191 [Botryobasidium botryosum FD-172 SS1]|uniref:Aminoglycoside phosphotransferase domain-containing protein n=1 Tax=Botryobasidium botryosum (strain FD-172 SS1) TaxID=930990 RepID=A0A067LUD3_BOTB1|nr:hypothetical protein BOTBODRAFT_182191 [Botryobasidium botryosum FD-172 SS1]
MDDGFEVIARLPFPKTLPISYATASEVATLRFLKKIDVPMPQVYAWRSTASRESNPVGAEFIIMEKLKGEELAKSWFTLSSTQRFDIARRVVEIENRIFSHTFPKHGSLYLLDDTVDTPSDEAFDSFVVGPTADDLAWYGERASMKLDPWKTAESYMRAIASRGIEFAKRHGKPRYPDVRVAETPLGYPEEHIDLLEKYEMIIPSVLPQDDYLRLPKLRHPDLHPNNTFVKPGTTEIVGIIDWQHACIAPPFLQAGICPVFSREDEPLPTNLKRPTLPDNYSGPSPEEKEIADEPHRQREVQHFYLLCTSQMAREHWDALHSNHSLTRQHLVEQAAVPWRGEVSALRASLINIVDYWHEIAPAGTPCPIGFSDKERELHAEREEEAKGLAEFVSALSDVMGIGEQGWVQSEDFDEAMKKHDELKAQWLASAEGAESEEVRNEVLQWWPFDVKDT